MEPELNDLHAPRLYLDPLSSRPVFVAPQRAAKPNDATLAAGLAVDSAPAHEWCPFCAGNEDRTPPDLARSPADSSVPWRSRIVPNHYPITTGVTSAIALHTPAGRPAIGVHEVVIESPRHDRSILALDPTAWQDVWELCRHRLATLAENESLAWATVFKNSGSRAGASLEHVHSQLVAIDMVPPAVAAELVGCRRGDPFGGLIADARAAGRVVAESGGLVALVPPAPRQPFETWIVTAVAERHFHDAGRDRVAALADLTRDVVSRLARVAPGCDYNWWLHQAPFLRAAADAELTTTWHWHLEILPRLAELAGFELGTGCHITTVSAEMSARRLRDAGGA
jgi:UDPglucose--hexose-1-phosphate uridylyltransferase